MEEIWKDIKGWKGLYQISSLGNVRSLNRIVKTKKGEREYKGRVLKSNIGTNGYRYVCLSSGIKISTKYIHKLVATNFLEEIEGCEVDHINSIKTDNRLVNLRYITHFENSSRANKGRHKDNSMEKNPKSKIVLGFIGDKIVKEYDCAKKLCNELGMNYSNFKKRMQNKGIVVNEIHYRYGIKSCKKI